MADSDSFSVVNMAMKTFALTIMLCCSAWILLRLVEAALYAYLILRLFPRSLNGYGAEAVVTLVQ